MSPLLRNPWLLGLVGAALAWLDIGVDLAGPDQSLYVPYVRHFAHPALYAHDYIFDSENYRATLFVPLVGMLHRIVGGELAPLLYVVHALTLFALFSGLAAATACVARGPAPAWIVTLLSWPPPVPGAAAALWEPSPHPRTLAVALAAWALRHVLDGRALPTALLAVAATLVHPLMGGAALLGGALALTVGPRRALATYLAAVALLLVGARLIWPVLTTSLPIRPVDWWLQVARGTFLWLQRWIWPVWLSMAGWIALFVLGRRAVRDEEGARLRRFGLAAVPLTALAFVGMLARSPLLVSLQLQRSGYVFLMATLVLTAASLAEAHESGRLATPPFVASALISFTQSVTVVLGALLATTVLARWRRAPPWFGTALAALLVVAVAVRFRPHHLPPSTEGDWMALQRWAARETPTDSTFLTPLHMPDFRVWSERASVVGAQDDQPTIFNHALADAWQSRRHALDGYATHDCAALGSAARRFGAAYVITDFDCAAPLVHRDGRYRVYDGARMSSR